MVKLGYKQTEVGVIPEDWEVNPIQSVVVSYRTGGNYKNSIEASSFPLIKMGNLSRGYINIKKIEYIAKGFEPNPMDKLQFGDVIFNTRNTPELVGKTAIWRNELQSAYYNSNLLRFEFDSNRIDPFFFNFILNTKEVLAELKNIAKGTTSVAAIYPQDLMKVKIQIPSLAEQEKISKVIVDLDDLLSILEKQIAKKKAIKQGAMQELLTGKKRLPGFSGEWENIVLGTVSSFYNGGTPSKKREDWWTGNIPWISSSDLSESSITSVKISHFISRDAVEHSATRICPKNAVLIVSRVGVGKVAISPCVLCTSQDFTTVVSSRHNPYFLAYVLVPIMEGLAIQAQGTSIKGVTIEDIQKIVIPTPTVDEQSKIVSILANMDSEIEVLEQNLVKYRQVKQGMMQQLLTGKIRLV